MVYKSLRMFVIAIITPYRDIQTKILYHFTANYPDQGHHHADVANYEDKLGDSQGI